MDTTTSVEILVVQANNENAAKNLEQAVYYFYIALV